MRSRSSDLARARALEQSILRRIVERIEPFEFGHAYLTAALSNVWDVNFVRAERRAPVDVLIEATDAIMGAARLRHRKVEIEDEPFGTEVAPNFAECGWRVTRFVVMVHDGRMPEVDDSVATELPPAHYPDAHREFLREERIFNEETVDQLLAKNRRVLEAADGRRFSVLSGGRVVSLCDLYSDGRTAQVEDVATLETHRKRGFARACVDLAVAEAYAGGHDLVFLTADDDDWPKEFYARMGFTDRKSVV